MSGSMARSAQHYQSLATWINSTLGLDSHAGVSEDAFYSSPWIDVNILWRMLETIDPHYTNKNQCEFDKSWDAETKIRIVKTRIAALLEISDHDIKYCHDNENQVITEQLADLVQFLLGCAVQCDFKEKHIATIMELDQNCQQCIAMEIDFVLVKSAKLKEVMINSNSSSSKFAQESPLSKTPGKTRNDYVKVEPYPSPFADKENILNNDATITTQLGPKLKRALRLNEALKIENEQLHEENKELMKKLENFNETSNRDRAATEDEHERTTTEKERKIVEAAMCEMKEREAELNAIVQEKDKTISELKVRVEGLSQDISNHRLVRDEIEVMRAQMKELTKLQQSNTKLREKLDIANGYKKQLDEIQSKNAELVRDRLQLEKQTKTLAQCRKDLESCKDSLTKSEMRNSELELILKDKEQHLLSLKEQCEEMRASEIQASMENAALQNDLKFLNEEQSNGVHVVQTQVLGNGISELNPEVREELERLQAENESLKEAASAQGEDNLRHLKLTLENMTRLKEGLETRLHDSNRNNQELSSSLQDTQERLTAKTEDFTKAEKQIAKLEMECKRLEKCQVQLESDCEQFNETIKDLQKMIQTKEATCTELKNLLNIAETKIENLECDIVKNTNRIQELDQKVTDLDEDNLALKQCISLKEKEIEMIKQKNEESIDSMKLSFETELEDKNRQIVLEQNKRKYDAIKHAKEMEESEISKVANQFTNKWIHESILNAVHESYESSKEKQAMEYEHKVAELNTHMEVLSEEIVTLNKESENMRSRSENLRGNLKESVNLIKLTKGELEQRTQEVKELKEKILKKEMAVKEAQNEVEEITLLMLGLKKELARIQGIFKFGQGRILEEQNHRAQAQKDLEDAKSTIEQQHVQLLQLRKQYKALQIQRNQTSNRAGGSQERTSELAHEVNRLLSEIRDLSERNAQLERQVSKHKRADIYENDEHEEVADLIRSYEDQLRVHVEEKRTLSLAKANELTLRHEIEQKAQRLHQENEELKAQIISLQLRVERNRTKTDKLNRAADKENWDNQNLEPLETDCMTPISKRRSAIGTPRSIGTPRTGLMAIPAVLEGRIRNNLDDVDSPSKCNQS